MNETLFSQIQRLLERTYAHVGINLEDCIIDRARSVHLSKLAGASSRELNEIARTYLLLLLFVAFFRKTQRVSRTDRRWLRFHLFSRQCPDAFRDENLRGRYLETCELAASYTQYLDTLNGVRRLDEIRKFRSLDYSAKKANIFALMERTAT